MKNVKNLCSKTYELINKNYKSICKIKNDLK